MNSTIRDPLRPSLPLSITFRSLIYKAHCEVIFAIAQLSCYIYDVDADGKNEEEEGLAAVGTCEEDLNVDDRRLTLSRVLAASRQQSRSSSYCPAANNPRFSHSHHHLHHHHHRYHQNRPAHSASTNCASCNIGRPNFRSEIVITSERETMPSHSAGGTLTSQPRSAGETVGSHSHSAPAIVTSHRQSCPRCFARTRSVTFARAASTTLSESSSTLAGHSARPVGSRSPPAASATDGRLTEGAVRPAGSAASAASGGRLTEEALRQRIERLLVEIPAHDQGHESQIVVALRQALVDSSAFPTHFAD